MGGQYGVTETLDFIDLGMTGAVIGKSILADGRIGLLELPQLFPLIGKTTKAIDGAQMVPLELGELDAEDQARIVAFITAKLPDVTDSARALKLAGLYLKAGLAAAEAIVETLKAPTLAAG